MIYITGDTHSDFRRFSRQIFPEQNEMSKDDYVMIAGDFGGIWYCTANTKNKKRRKPQVERAGSKTFYHAFCSRKP